ncbi:MAG: hypothetical protein SGPRY_002461 [Prymnesium sp.]
MKASCVGLDEAQAYADAAPGTVVMVGHGRLQLQLELARNYLLQLISTSSQPVLRAGMHVVSGDCLPVCWALVRLLAYHEVSPLCSSRAEVLHLHVMCRDGLQCQLLLHDFTKILLLGSCRVTSVDSPSIEFRSVAFDTCDAFPQQSHEGKPALADEAQRLLIDVWRAEMDLHDEIPINKVVPQPRASISEFVETD